MYDQAVQAPGESVPSSLVPPSPAGKGQGPGPDPIPGDDPFDIPRINAVRPNRVKSKPGTDDDDILGKE